MKVRDRIGVIADLFLGVLCAGGRLRDAEGRALREMLCALICRPELPPQLEQQIASFDPERFDLAATARSFSSDPPMRARRLLELASDLCFADGELDLEKDEYMHRLARALGMEPVEYEDILLDYEVHELRRSFELLSVPEARLDEPSTSEAEISAVRPLPSVSAVA